MTIDVRKTHFSIAEYLAGERSSRDKHEYRDGEILLMAGGSADHSLVIANVIGELRNLLKGKPCTVYDSNLRVRIPRTVLSTYPDATVICGPRVVDPNDAQGETVTNPRLIVEVLSANTEAYDRGEKFARYRQLEGFEEYVLVSMTMARVETFYRAPAAVDSKEHEAGREPAEGAWVITTASGVEASVALRSLKVSLALAEVYRGLEFGGAVLGSGPL